MSVDQNINTKISSNKNIILYVSIFIIGAVAYYLSIINEDPTVFPKSITDEFKFTAWINVTIYVCRPKYKYQK